MNGGAGLQDPIMGTLLILGFVSYTAFTLACSRLRCGISRSRILVLYAVYQVAFYVGSLLLYSMTHALEGGVDARSGFTQIGGFIAVSALIVILGVCWGGESAKMYHLWILGFFWSGVWGRIGCYMVGCCPGVPMGDVSGLLRWLGSGVNNALGSAACLQQYVVLDAFPFQIISSLLFFVLASVHLMLFLLRVDLVSLNLLSVVLYGGMRFFEAWIRVFHDSSAALLPISSFVGMLIVVLGIALLTHRIGRNGTLL